MVLISSKKYACETCIKGHRSSTCKHTDRPLYEIKKKGRPVTQCEHCRELRKTKQVHVKCICEVKAESSLSQPSSSGRKGTKIPQSAAFPNGLPHELEAAIASQFAQEGFSSDSSHGVKEQSCCGCKMGAPCTCWTPRHSSARQNGVSKIHAGSSEDARSSEATVSGQPQARLSMSHILARVKELRPVLPRPTNSPNGGPVHDLSSGLPHYIPNRHHMYDNVMFSPYGRAYDRTHDHPFGHHLPGPPVSYQAMLQDGLYAASGSQAEPISLGNFSLTSACSCGDTCHCTGCEPNKAVGSHSNCTGNNCPSCLECSYFIPPPPATQHSSQRIAIDEWLRQVSTPPTGSDTAAFQQNFLRQERLSSIEGTPQNLGINGQSESVWNETLPPTVHHNLQPSNSSDDGHTHASTPEHCIGHCSCPSQSCQCQRCDYFAIGDTSNSNERASDCAERLGQLQMSQGMSRSDTHLVLPEVYQNRPLSAPLQRNLGVQRLCMTNISDLPYSASMSALDVTTGTDYVGNSQSAVQALIGFPNTNGNTSSSVSNMIIPWGTGNDETDPTSAPGVMPPMYPYAVSNSGTDGTSSYDDLSMTLRTPL